MKCFIYNPENEAIPSEAFLSLGYEAHSFPVSTPDGALAQSEYNLSAHGAFYAFCNTLQVRQRRATFVKMLLEATDDAPVIFADSGAIPAVSSGILREAIDQGLARHPEADVFRLDAYHTSTPEASVAFEAFSEQHCSPTGQPYSARPRAFVVLPRGRKAVAEILRNCPLPVEMALESAHLAHDLTLLVPNLNLVRQTVAPATNAGVIVPDIWTNRKMALCLASYKRPEDLQRQLYTMLDQTYDHFHIFVALKGIPEYIANTFILPQFQHAIEAGRLTIRLFPNTNQFTNLLDTVRGLDVSSFDLFLKIDDDDFYSRDYLATINDFYMYIPKTLSCIYQGKSRILLRKRGMLTLGVQDYRMNGSTQVMTKQVFSRLHEAEQRPEIVRSILGHSNIAYLEDAFNDAVMSIYGKANILPYLIRKGIDNHYMVQQSNASVLRGGLVADDLRKHTDVCETDMPREDFIFVCHPNWEDTLRLYDGRATRAANGDSAQILSYTGDSLCLKWDAWGCERFSKNDNGAFTLNR